jgi:hypothetical protein
MEEFRFEDGKLVKDLRDPRDVSLGLPASLRDIAQLSHKHYNQGPLISQRSLTLCLSTQLSWVVLFSILTRKPNGASKL